jgi:hypothetical protein
MTVYYFYTEDAGVMPPYNHQDTGIITKKKKRKEKEHEWISPLRY